MNTWNFGQRAIRAFFAAALCFTMVPATAFAEVVDEQDVTQLSQPMPDDAEGSAFETVGADELRSGEADQSLLGDPIPATDASAFAPEGHPIEGDAEADGGSVSGVPLGGILSEERPIDAVVARAESTRSYFLAQTLESTRTVPMVSAKLPVNGDTPDEVIGSFIHRGITYAVEPGGESVAVVAADFAQVPQDALDARAVMLPSAVSPDGIESYRVSRIGEGAFAGLMASAVTVASEGERTDPDSIIVIGIPASVTTVEDGAFAGFETVRYLVVSSDNPTYSMYDGCLYDKSQTSLLLIPEGRLGAVRIASSVTNVDPEVFSHCPLVDTIVADVDSAAYAALEDVEIHNANGERIEVTDDPAFAAFEGVYDPALAVEKPLSTEDEPSGPAFDGAEGTRSSEVVDGKAEGPEEPVVPAEPAEEARGSQGDPSQDHGHDIVASDGTPIVSRSVELEPSEARVSAAAASANEFKVGINEDGTLASTGGDLAMRMGNPAGTASLGNYVISAGRGFWGTITWTGASSDGAPAPGAIVNVEVRKLIQTGGEGTLDLMRYKSILTWGAAENGEFLGMTNPMTGSYVSAETIHSGKPFSFSFKVPPSGCSVTSNGISWVDWDNSEYKFYPVFSGTTDTEQYNVFDLNLPDSRWKNPSTDTLVGGTPAAVYSTIGGPIQVPQDSIPYHSNYVFLGWSNSKGDIGAMDDPATGTASSDSRTYYARWAPKSTENIIEVGINEDGTLADAGGNLSLRMGNPTGTASLGSYVISAGGGFWGTITWTGASSNGAPAPGAIVNVAVQKLIQTGEEGTLDLMRYKSIYSWGAAQNGEFLGMTNPMTGSYVSAETIHSGKPFSFSFKVPPSGCSITAKEISWIDWSNSEYKFYPVFAGRTVTEQYNVFDLNLSGARWKNPNTNTLVSGSQAAVYSTIGDIVQTPQHSIPYHPDHVFLGWSTSPGSGSGFDDPITEAASATPQTYYARWSSSGGSLSIGLEEDDSFKARGGSLNMRVGNLQGTGGLSRYVISASGGFWGKISWEKDDGGKPAVDSYVYVEVMKLIQYGDEATIDTMRNASVAAWGASSDKLFIGIRNYQTSCYVGLEQIQSGGRFCFSFKMPANGCTVNSNGIEWTSSTSSSAAYYYRPEFATLSNSVYNHFSLNDAAAKWRNPSTNALVSGAIATVYSTIGGAVQTPQNAIPVKEGYTFLGWYTAPSGGHLITGTAQANTRTYYAHWGNEDTEYYTITLRSDTTASAQQTIENYQVGHSFSLAGTAFTKPGHTLSAWKDAAGNTYDLETEYTKLADGSALTASTTLTLYAQWTLDTYDLTYVLGGGAWPTSGSVVHPASFNYETSTFTITDPVRTGYDFVGWTGTGLSTATKGLTIIKGSIDDKQFERTYTAHWTPRTYKMTFDLSFDDGSASWKAGEAPAAGAYDAIVYDTAVTFPKAPVRAGWIFTGWVPVDADAVKDDYAAGETVSAGNFKADQDATASFEAHWVRNLEVTVPVGGDTASLSVTADWDADEFLIDEGEGKLVNLSDGDIEVISIAEDASDPTALAERKENARKAFSARTSDAGALDAMLAGVKLLVRPVQGGEQAAFPLFGSYALTRGDWVLPASTDPVNGTAASALELAFGLDIDRTLVSPLDLKIGLESKAISSLVYTVGLVDATEPSYSASA